MAEEWRDIKGYEGYYQVSNMGRVRSLDRIVKSRPGRTRIARGRVMSPGYCCGYLKVVLYKDKKYRNALIHRLVAEAFIEPIEGKPHVDHINGNKHDNRVENLRWVTISENNLYANYEQGLCDKEKQRQHGFDTVKRFGTATPPKPVIRSDGAVFESVSAAARAIGTSQGNVSSMLRGRTKTCKGYTFKFVEQAS